MYGKGLSLLRQIESISKVFDCGNDWAGRLLWSCVIYTVELVPVTWREATPVQQLENAVDLEIRGHPLRAKTRNLDAYSFMEATKAWQQAAFSSVVERSSRTCTDYHRKMQRHPRCGMKTNLKSRGS